MAKGKTTDEEQASTSSADVKGSADDGLVTVVAVERVFRRAENRYVEPGEEVALEPELAALLVELGVVVAASTGSADG